jgi:Tol biopolymer transport system component
MRPALTIAAAVIALAAAGAHGSDPPGALEVALKEPGAFGEARIVLVDADGQGAVEITRGRPTPWEFGSFSWSPDGSQLVYGSRGIVGGDLYAVRVDGSGVRRLTFDGGNSSPAWSPDGTSIAYLHTTRTREPGGLYDLNTDVWLLDAQGGNHARRSRDGGQKGTPAWSPDARRLLYSRVGTDGPSGVFTMDAETGSAHLAATGGSGAWSPDGASIALQTGSDITVMASDATGAHVVAKGAGGAVWSPDGSTLAVQRHHCVPGIKGMCRTILSSIYTVPATGGAEHRLTGPIGGGAAASIDGSPNDASSSPAWWPDGSRLFFERQGRTYVMNSDGTCEQPWGNGDPSLAPPLWSPVASPAPPPLACVDLRLRAVGLTGTSKKGADRVAVAIENDGNENASRPTLTLRPEREVRSVTLPRASCRRGSALVCVLRPLAAGGGTSLVVDLSRVPRGIATISLAVAGPETDADPSNNAARVTVG